MESEATFGNITIADLSEKMKEAVARAGWQELMNVQAKAMPYLLNGKDVMIQSHTGSGKTAAFVLPIIDRIDPARSECQALVLVPTRELAKQVAAEATMLAGEDGLRVVSVYGGVGYKEQLEGFELGAHLVVGTPGRILDHLLRRNLKLDGLDMLIFDEADRMLSMGFLPDMRELRRYLPDRPLYSAMFSATFPPHVLGLAKQFLKEPETLSLSQDNVHVTEITHACYVVKPMEKDRSLVRVIEQLNPTSAIIFCNTKAKTHYLSEALQRFGYDADELSSDLTQGAREKVLKRVHDGSLRFLVATDIAARGIDIPGLSHVIHYEVPEDAEIYVHRSGRTGRAGASGEAITLATVMEKIALNRIVKRDGMELIEREVPSQEDVERIVSERTTALLETQLRKRDGMQVERLKRFLPLAKEMSESDDELTVIAMLLDDFYQNALHAPVAPPEPPERLSSRNSSRDSGRNRSRGGSRNSGRSKGRRSPRRKSSGE